MHHILMVPKQVKLELLIASSSARMRCPFFDSVRASFKGSDDEHAEAERVFLMLDRRVDEKEASDSTYRIPGVSGFSSYSVFARYYFRSVWDALMSIFFN